MKHRIKYEILPVVSCFAIAFGAWMDGLQWQSGFGVGVGLVMAAVSTRDWWRARKRAEAA